MNEVRADFHIFRVAAVHVAACGEEVRTEILLARFAEVTFAARGGDPRHADALAGTTEVVTTWWQAGMTEVVTTWGVFHNSNYLMTENDRQMGRGSPPFDFVQFRVADSATRDTDQYFARVGFRFGDFFERKGSGILRQWSKSAQEHGFHALSVIQNRAACDCRPVGVDEILSYFFEVEVVEIGAGFPVANPQTNLTDINLQVNVADEHSVDPDGHG